MSDDGAPAGHVAEHLHGLVGGLQVGGAAQRLRRLRPGAATGRGARRGGAASRTGGSLTLRIRWSKRIRPQSARGSSLSKKTPAALRASSILPLLAMLPLMSIASTVVRALAFGGDSSNSATGLPSSSTTIFSSAPSSATRLAVAGARQLELHGDVQRRRLAGRLAEGGEDLVGDLQVVIHAGRSLRDDGEGGAGPGSGPQEQGGRAWGKPLPAPLAI